MKRRPGQKIPWHLKPHLDNIWLQRLQGNPEVVGGTLDQRYDRKPLHFEENPSVEEITGHDVGVVFGD